MLGHRCLIDSKDKRSSVNNEMVHIFNENDAEHHLFFVAIIVFYYTYRDPISGIADVAPLAITEPICKI